MRRVLLGSVLVLIIAGCQPTPESVATTGPSAAAPTGIAAATSAAPSASDAATATTPAATATPTPTTAPTAAPTPSPSPTPQPTPAPILACRATQLKAKVTAWEGAMGSQIAAVTLTNASSGSCEVRGTPEVQLVGANGAILVDSKTAGASGLPHVAPGDHAFVLAHGGAVKTQVQVANYCGPTPVLPTTVALVLPSSAGRIVAATGPGGGVPDCLGAPGSSGDIAMNGWTR